MGKTDAKLISMTSGHRTKEEIRYRQEGERQLTVSQKFKAEEATKKDPIALKEFRRLKKLYAEIDFVGALDQSLINRYVREFAGIQRAEDRLAELQAMADETEERGEKLEIMRLIMSQEAQIMASKKIMVTYEDRLLLNPTSRVKAVPKTPEKKQALSPMAMHMQRMG